MPQPLRVYRELAARVSLIDANTQTALTRFDYVHHAWDRDLSEYITLAETTGPVLARIQHLTRERMVPVLQCGLEALDLLAETVGKTKSRDIERAVAPQPGKRATLQGLLDRLGEVTKDRSLIGRWIILLYCGVVGGAAQARSLAQAQPEPEARALVAPESFVEVVALARARKEGILANQLEGDVHLVRFEPGVIEFHPGARAPNDLAGRLGRCLQDWTGRRWMVGVTSASGAPSLREQRQAREAERLEEAARDPLVQEVMSLFPGARIVAVREAAADPGRDRDDPEPPTANEAQEDER